MVQEGKAVILVTHALHLLEYTDYVYTLDDGHIAEHGTYKQLIANNGEFARLDREFSGRELQPQAEQRPDIRPEAAAVEEFSTQTPCLNAAGSGKLEGRLIVQERRATGSVPWTGEYRETIITVTVLLTRFFSKCTLVTCELERD